MSIVDQQSPAVVYVMTALDEITLMTPLHQVAKHVQCFCGVSWGVAYDLQTKVFNAVFWREKNVVTLGTQNSHSQIDRKSSGEHSTTTLRLSTTDVKEN